MQHNKTIIGIVVFGNDLRYLHPVHGFHVAGVYRRFERIGMYLQMQTLQLRHIVLELVEVIEEFIKKKTETNDEESLIQEIVPMVKVDPIEVPLPIHGKPQPSEPESEILDLLSISANTYFSKDINEPALKAFIKTNPNRFSSGEDMAFSLIDCVGYSQLSNACAKVKTILHDKWHDANEEMVNKYQDFWEDLQIFILN